MLGKDSLAKLVLLTEPDRAEASALEAEVETSDATEKRADNHRPTFHLLTASADTLASAPTWRRLMPSLSS